MTKFAPGVLAWADSLYNGENLTYATDLKLPLQNWFYMLVLLAAYLSLVFFIRVVMVPFKEFSLKGPAIVYNVFMTLLSAYMAIEAFTQATKLGYNWFGNYSQRSPAEHALARVIWVFYFSKHIEGIDTLFIVLRKRNRQLSFLHLYHHTSITMIWHLIFRCYPAGEAYYSVVANSFIHVIMYGYYACTLLKINVKPFKFFITYGQLAQFLSMLSQAVYDLYILNVTEARWLLELLLGYMFTMLATFGHFLYYEKKRIAALKKNKKKSA